MIAILGASGYIGKSLAREFIARGDDSLVLFARDTERLRLEGWPAGVRFGELSKFTASGFDLVVNAIGAGDPSRVASMGAEILEVTQRWDDAVLSTMGKKTAYVFLSSGAIYGGGFGRAADSDDILSVPVNQLGSVPPYTIAKLYAEAKHRARVEQPILDLRIFGYADETIDRTGRFFLAEFARSISRGTPFITSPQDMTRDYAGRRELADLILAWKSSGCTNLSADLYTIAPVSKKELIDIAKARYGLEAVILKDGFDNPTGQKNIYASQNHAASVIGYQPQRSALEIVLDMLDVIAAR